MKRLIIKYSCYNSLLQVMSDIYLNVHNCQCLCSGLRFLLSSSRQSIINRWSQVSKRIQRAFLYSTSCVFQIQHHVFSIFNSMCFLYSASCVFYIQHHVFSIFNIMCFLYLTSCVFYIQHHVQCYCWKYTLWCMFYMCSTSKKANWFFTLVCAKAENKLKERLEKKYRDGLLEWQLFM